MHRSLEELPVELQQGGLVTRYTEWGDMAVRYADIPAGTDLGPVLEGLPGDRCPSPHWGMVLDGAIRVEQADGSEDVVRGGQAYYWPAGHTAVTEERTALLEVGPVAPMRQFGDHAKAKLG